MSIYQQLMNDKRRHPNGWAVRAPDRKRGYWTQRLQGCVLDRLRYERMYARGRPRVRRTMRDRRHIAVHPHFYRQPLVTRREAEYFRAIGYLSGFNP